VFTADTTIFAQWSQLEDGARPPFTITFDPQGGDWNSPTRQTDANGRFFQQIGTPRKEGYNFDGWWTAPQDDNADNSGVRITTGNNGYVFTADSTIFARWIAGNVFTITLDPRGGDLGERFPGQLGTIRTDATARITPHGSIPTPIREGYTLIGWFSEPETGGIQINPPNSFTTFTADRTIYARWREGLFYNIRINLNGGDIPGMPTYMTETRADGRFFGLGNAVPVRDGYEFAGWYNDFIFGEQVFFGEGGTVFLRDTEVYARWNRVNTSAS
jgi:hypothetical protein